MALGGNHAVLARPNDQGLLRFPFRQTGLHTEPHQGIDVSDVDALLEIAAHDPVLDLALTAVPRGMRQQQVREARVRHALDQIEAKLNAAGRAEPQKFGIHFRRALRTDAARGEKRGARHAVHGHLRVELKRAPAHLCVILRARCHGEFQTPLPQKAPRANGVRINVNSHGSIPLIRPDCNPAPSGVRYEQV
jgi:hypothetical protein